MWLGVSVKYPLSPLRAVPLHKVMVWWRSTMQTTDCVAVFTRDVDSRHRTLDPRGKSQAAARSSESFKLDPSKTLLSSDL